MQGFPYPASAAPPDVRGHLANTVGEAGAHRLVDADPRGQVQRHATRIAGGRRVWDGGATGETP